MPAKTFSACLCLSLQQAAITTEVEAAAAAVEAELDAQEWNMQEIERIQEEQASPMSLLCYSTTYLWLLPDHPSLQLGLRDREVVNALMHALKADLSSVSC